MLNPLEGDSHGDEARAHEAGREHVHVTAFEAGDDDGDNGSVEERPAGVGQVDAGLGVVGGVAHHAEQNPGVVAEKGVAGELGEETDEKGDVETATETIGFEELHPGLVGNLHLGSDGLANLRDLSLNKKRAGITLSVVLDQDGAGLIITVLGNEVTGRLGEEENSADLEEGGADLEQGRDTPGPIALDISGS